MIKIFLMIKKLLNISIIGITIVLSACEKDESVHTSATFNPNITYGSMIDQEGNVYKTVTIGTQTWMAENLRTTIYNDGTSIAHVSDSNIWDTLTIGGFCTYENTVNKEKITTYGCLYNWYALNTSKLSPIGWHISTDAEWTVLTDYLGGEIIAGAKLKEAGTNHWSSPNFEADNESGFTALPGGYRYADGTSFDQIKHGGSWWCTDEYDTNYARTRYMSYDNSYVVRVYGNKQLGMSIRCVKD